LRSPAWAEQIRPEKDDGHQSEKKAAVQHAARYLNSELNSSCPVRAARATGNASHFQPFCHCLNHSVPYDSINHGEGKKLEAEQRFQSGL
jgi:hypothetical protein